MTSVRYMVENCEDCGLISVVKGACSKAGLIGEVCAVVVY